MSARGSIGAAALVLSGAALFGTVGTAQLLVSGVPTVELAAARLMLAGLLLGMIAAASGRLGDIPWRRGPTWWAAAGQAGFNLCFLGAMSQAGVAVGTLIAIGATPVVTGLVTRRVSPGWLVATAVAIGGLVLLMVGQMLTGDAQMRPLSVLGVALALGASVSYATYILAGGRAESLGLPTQPFLAGSFLISAAITSPILLLGDLSWVGDLGGALLVVYLAAVPTVVAYSLFNRGLHGVRPNTASTLGLIEPVVAALLAYVVLGERLTGVGLVGAFLILVGLALIIRSPGTAAVAGGR